MTIVDLVYTNIKIRDIGVNYWNYAIYNFIHLIFMKIIFSECPSFKVNYTWSLKDY